MNSNNFDSSQNIRKFLAGIFVGISASYVFFKIKKILLKKINKNNNSNTHANINTNTNTHTNINTHTHTHTNTHTYNNDNDNDCLPYDEDFNNKNPQNLQQNKINLYHQNFDLDLQTQKKLLEDKNESALLKEQLKRNYEFFSEEGMKLISNSFVVVVGIGGVGRYNFFTLIKIFIHLLKYLFILVM